MVIVMNEEVKAEVLEKLRELTNLGPIAKLKLQRARRSAEKFRDLYIKENPSDQIGVDYSTANDLEYELRMNSLRNSMAKSWKEYLDYENDGLGLEEYVSDYLVRELNKDHGMKM